MNSSSTVDSMKAYVSNMSVEVFTCFEVALRRRRSDATGNRVERKAFRLCINASHRDKLEDPTGWADSIIVREWYFKQGADGDDRRSRPADVAAGSGNAADDAVVAGMVTANKQREDDMMTSSDETLLAAGDNLQRNDGY